MTAYAQGRSCYYKVVDVEKTIEFILEHQAQMHVTMAEQAAIVSSWLAERDAIGRRTDARLDRAIKFAAEEARRERQRRRALTDEVSKLTDDVSKLAESQLATQDALQDLKATVDRYIQARGNGQN